MNATATTNTDTEATNTDTTTTTTTMSELEQEQVHEPQPQHHPTTDTNYGDDEEIIINIVSAVYGPCEGHVANKIPYTRDVTPIVRALLQWQEQDPSAADDSAGGVPAPAEATTTTTKGIAISKKRSTNDPSTTVDDDNNDDYDDDDDDDDPHLVRLKAIAGGKMGGMKRTSITVQALQDGWNSMNVVFGDACPGTSKKLDIDYVILHHHNNNHNNNAESQTLPKNLKHNHVTTTREVHHVSFAEYEPVILRRRVTFYQDEESLQQATARVLAKKVQNNNSHPNTVKEILLTTFQEEKDAIVTATRCQRPDDNIQLAKNDDPDEHTLLVARRMGRTESILEFAQLSVSGSNDNNNNNNNNNHGNHDQVIAATSTSLAGATDNLCEESLSLSPTAKRTKRMTETTNSTLPLSFQSQDPCSTTTTPTKSRLRSASFEIVLPIVLSFLQIPERITCRLVCRLWRNIVRDWGVASVIDYSDPNFGGGGGGQQQHLFTRPFLRGILSHSYSSLHSLRLSDFVALQGEDLHPSLPHLRKLRVLDISRCVQLKDETLQLLAQHVSNTLEVLYIKGLVHVTDVGLVAICQSCRDKLKVLEVSYIPMITDESGLAMGHFLTNLRALYMRDNFRLTNRSIDAITANCTKLNQLTLWGCVKVKHLHFDGSSSGLGSCDNQQCHNIITGAASITGGGVMSGSGSLDYSNNDGMMLHHHYSVFGHSSGGTGKLVSLNLWGCFKLGDDLAVALGNMKNLRSLIVSECHRLTDQFAIGIAQNIPTLVHLHLRYCKRLTDNGVNAIANGLRSLYSLDLSFCSRVTSNSICGLLELRHQTLSELRLQECRQLKITRDPEDDDDGLHGRSGGRQDNHVPRPARDGQAILKYLKSPSGRSCLLSSTTLESNLSMLDLRCCGGQPNREVGYPEEDPFVRGMKSLQFEQRTPGFFARPARWNANVHQRLLEQLESNSRWTIYEDKAKSL